MDELWEIVRAIPAGKVVSYGAAGRMMANPRTGRAVGRMMASCPTEIPWWRVVAKSGLLPVGKRDPNLEIIQSDQLISEGVEVIGGRVLAEYFID